MRGETTWTRVRTRFATIEAKWEWLDVEEPLRLNPERLRYMLRPHWFIDFKCENEVIRDLAYSALQASLGRDI